MPYVDREGTPEHTTHHESCGCSEAREARLRAECERLRVALKPFAEQVDEWMLDEDNDHMATWWGLTFGDFRRAAAALEGEPVEEGDA